MWSLLAVLTCVTNSTCSGETPATTRQPPPIPNPQPTVLRSTVTTWIGWLPPGMHKKSATTNKKRKAEEAEAARQATTAAEPATPLPVKRLHSWLGRMYPLDACLHVTPTS